MTSCSIMIVSYSRLKGFRRKKAALAGRLGRFACSQSASVQPMSPASKEIPAVELFGKGPEPVSLTRHVSRGLFGALGSMLRKSCESIDLRGTSKMGFTIGHVPLCGKAPRPPVGAPHHSPPAADSGLLAVAARLPAALETCRRPARQPPFARACPGCSASHRGSPNEDLQGSQRLAGTPREASTGFLKGLDS